MQSIDDLQHIMTTRTEAHIAPLSEEDVMPLYDLLRERKTYQCIEHDPNQEVQWSDHVKYLKEFPGHVWVIHVAIRNTVEVAGMVTLKNLDSVHPEVGIFLFETNQSCGLGSWALRRLIKMGCIPKGTVAKINCRNKPSLKFFGDMGFEDWYVVKRLKI